MFAKENPVKLLNGDTIDTEITISVPEIDISLVDMFKRPILDCSTV